MATADLFLSVSSPARPQQETLIVGLPFTFTLALVMFAVTALLVRGLFIEARGGVVATFYMQSGNPASFVGLELDAIAAGGLLFVFILLQQLLVRLKK